MFEVDRTHDYFDSYARSDAIITDVSGTGFTFAFTFGRPAVYFAPNRELEAGRSGIQFESREKIGYVARSVQDVANCVRTAVGSAESLRVQIERFRDELIFNPGCSEEYFLGWATTAEGLMAG
jgi:CDP-glycerol glycerophosphotransferase (TagB/SpsB family)